MGFVYKYGQYFTDPDVTVQKQYICKRDTSTKKNMYENMSDN